MTNETTTSATESELDDRAAKLDSYITGLNSAKIPADMEDVAKRFTRDCETLKEDMFSKQRPTLEDLNDYADLGSTLDVRYHLLKQKFQ